MYITVYFRILNPRDMFVGSRSTMVIRKIKKYPVSFDNDFVQWISARGII